MEKEKRDVGKSPNVSEKEKTCLSEKKEEQEGRRLAQSLSQIKNTIMVMWGERGVGRSTAT